MHMIQLTVGDTRPDPQFDLRDANTGVPDDPNTWTKENISDAATTVSMWIKKSGSTAAATEVVCTKVDLYIFRLPLASCPFTTSGDYDGQIRLVKAGEQRILDKILFRVNPKL